jgi:hypothetical protein
LWQSHFLSDADERAADVPVETHFAAAERHGQIDVAVVVEVGPGIRIRVGDAEKIGLHGLEGRPEHLRRRRRGMRRGVDGRRRYESEGHDFDKGLQLHYDS